MTKSRDHQGGHALDRTALIEIGCEELPSGPLPALRDALRERARSLRAEYRLGDGPVAVSGTPQRLVVMLHDLPDLQDPRTETVLGPPARLAGTLPDAPSPQAEGFARNQGMSVKDLMVEETAKGAYLAIRKVLPCQGTGEVLRELLSRIPEGLPLPKSMRWGESSGPFLRPVLWVLALWGNQPVPMTFAGIASGSVTRSPRSLGFQKVPVRGVSHYMSLVEKEWGVILDPSERRQAIERDLDLALKMEQDSSVLPRSVRRIEDPDLSSEVADLVETFRVVTGSFPDAYLSLPAPLIRTVLKVHQRFFVLENEDRSLSSRFLAVSANPGADSAVVRSGFEKVVRARLEDAQYYLSRDRRRTLESFAVDLKGLAFFPGVGSLADKARMAREMVLWVLEHVPDSDIAKTGLDRPTLSDSLDGLSVLAKADLATGLVREFPELEGVIGGHYWSLERAPDVERGGKDAVRARLEARAIAEHYRPRHLQDLLPETLPGRILSLVDKFLHQVGGFGAGFVPSGSEDPYALRRAAVGMFSLLIETAWPISLDRLADKAGEILTGRDVADGLRKFWRERLQSYWEREYPVLLVRASILSDSEYLGTIRGRIRFLSGATGFAEWERVSSLYTRLVNILPKDSGATTFPIDASRIKDASERTLLKLVEEAGLYRENGWKEFARDGQWGILWERASAFVDPVERFFEEVLVNDPDPVLKSNRLGLLSRLREGLECLGRLNLLSPAPAREG